MDANQLAKTFACEYHWLLRLCGEECLTHMCICAHEEALPPLCVIASCTGHSFCLREIFAKKKKKEVPDLHVSQKSKI